MIWIHSHRTLDYAARLLTSPFHQRQTNPQEEKKKEKEEEADLGAGMDLFGGGEGY